MGAKDARTLGKEKRGMKEIRLVFALSVILSAAPAFSQNSVHLNWQASSSAAGNPSLTYDVYRASTCAGPFTKLNASGVSATNFVDTGVGAGATYCYQVTSVLAGIESTVSNQVIAAMPFPANRQSGCAHHGAVIGWIRCIITRPKGPSVSQTP